MAVGIRAERQNVVSLAVVGFPPGVNGGISSLQEDGSYRTVPERAVSTAARPRSEAPVTRALTVFSYILGHPGVGSEGRNRSSATERGGRPEYRQRIYVTNTSVDV